MRSAWHVALFAAACFVLASCASSRGNSYSAGASRESAAAAASARAKQDEEAHRKPLPQGPQAPSPSTDRPYFALAQTDLPLALEPRKGRLLLEGLPAEAHVAVDGFPQLGSTAWMGIDLEAGTHSVEVRTFGYEDWKEDIIVGEGALVRLSPLLEAASFGLRNFGLWPRRFNPDDPGFYGTVLISLEAFAPGTLTIQILAPGARIVRELRDISIDRDNWSWAWDGRDEGGKLLGEGLYSAVAMDGAGVELARAELSLDHSSMARSAILVSGVGGPLFVPAARPMAVGALEVSSFVMGHVLSSSGTPTGRIVSGLGSRMGLPLPASAGGNKGEEAMEFDLSIAGFFHPGEAAAQSSDAFELSASLLVPMASTPAQASLLVKFCYGSFFAAGDWPSPYDGLARYPGLSLALPIEYELDELRVFIAPEIDVGPFYPNYDPARVPGFYSWAYLRGGVETTLGPLSLALSGALRSAPFDRGILLAMPLPAVLEVRWHARKVPLVLSFLLSGEFDSAMSWYLNSGLSLGYRL
ncbi:MAG TPA: PEGA domain-containing protein [Rectinemataceae bacterium]|nr:PEGA domain-containing protein [Rectinemataceae bacterium]